MISQRGGDEQEQTWVAQHVMDWMPRPGREAMETDAAEIDSALLENWALSYLGRYASTAENLRRVLRRRTMRRRGADRSATDAVFVLIDALVARYRAAGLVDDAAYAAGRARRGLAQGRSLRRIASGLAAKGVAAADTAAAIAGLRESSDDPELAAACAFARRRRFGPYRTGLAEPQRELAAFARAGFARHTAQAVLACADPEAVDAMLTSGEDRS
jgi:regulatory protein